MAPAAAYDEIADWYEHEFLAAVTTPGADPLGIDASLGSLLVSSRKSCGRVGEPAQLGIENWPGASLTWLSEVPVRSRAPMDRAVCFPGL